MNKLTERLDNVLNSERQNTPKYLQEVIKSDLFYLLTNYFDLEYDSVSVDITVDENRQYIVNMSCKSDRPKNFGAVSSF